VPTRFFDGIQAKLQNDFTQQPKRVKILRGARELHATKEKLSAKKVTGDKQASRRRFFIFSLVTYHFPAPS
jgi:hypothetical protein